MLSVENPPSDSHLKTDDDDDENIKTSCSNIGAVDLLNSDFDVSRNKFSIRDYVYSARSKDIATNWPFSEKNLQQCRKLGVTNFLPPFQHVDSVKSMSVKKCVVYDILADQANESNLEGKATSQFGQDELVSVNGATCNQKLKTDHLHIATSVSDQGEKDVLSEVEKSYSAKDSEAAILLEPSTKQVEAEIFPVSCKTVKISKPEPLVKKSRLVVKLGTLAGPSTKEDNMTNNFIVSEIMASKVCPVCKTFSSSSNTTLNAHIDQCLSGESTIKWTEEPKVIKHKIKPRKMRLMRDIYATALHCTLEDLDRRNGTNWASNSTPPDKSNDLCVEDRLERLPSAGIRIEETGHKEGEVYIDTDGTKVRILSKFTKEATIQGNSRAQNILNCNKFIADKKKKKHKKILKLVTHGKPCSSKPHPNFETCRNLTMGLSGEEEVELGQCSKSEDQIKFDDSGIIRRWVGSKRTGLTKKSPPVDKHQNAGQSLAKSYADSNCLLNKQHSFKSLSSSETKNKMETSRNEAGFRLYKDQAPLGKKREFPWSSEGVGYRKRSMILPKHKKLGKEGASVHDSCNKSPNHTSTRATSFSNKAAPTKMSDAFVTSKTSRTHQEFSSKATISASTRTKLTNQVVVPKPQSHIKRKSSVSTRSHFESQLKIKNNFAWRLSQNDDDQQIDSMEDFMEEKIGKMACSQANVLRDRRSINFSRKEEADCLKNSTNQPRNYGHGVGVMKEFSPVNIRSALEDSEDSFDDEESDSEEGLAFGEDVTIEPASTVANRGFKSCSDSLVSEFPKLPSSPEKSQSEQCAEVDQWDSCGHPTSSRGPSLSDEQVYSADGNGRTGEFNYFSEVDPIPIPGPPGSFLPSLGHMGSGDLQGNLLNTSQVQSAEDQHDFVDMDKSDSPVSAISDISNPTLAMSKSRSLKNFAADPLSAQDEIQRGFLGAQVSQAANLGPEHLNQDISRISVMSFPEKGPVSSKFEQLCCCSREQGTQGVAFNHQESQLLRQQTMPLDSFPNMQIDNDCSERLGNLNSRSGTFYFRNHPNSGPGKVVYPIRKFASEHTDKIVSAEHEVKFSALRDFDSASPSAPNPVLRLMGKNLMVVNKDEVPLLQHRQHQSSSMDSQPHLQCSTVSEVYPCGVRNKDYYSYHQVVAQGPIAFSQDQRQDAFGQKFDANLPRNFEGNVDVETPQLPYHASAVMFPSMNVAGAFKSSLGQHDYKVGINMLAEERPRNKMNNPPAYGLQKNVATSGAKLWDVGSTSSREIIIIDDPTNNEADFSTGTRCHDGKGKIGVSSSRNATNSISGDSRFSSRFTTSYNSNPSEGAGYFYGGQPLMHSASFQMPVSEGVNASPVMWSCNSEGLSFLRPNSLSSSSNSANHLRQKIYYSPTLS